MLETSLTKRNFQSNVNLTPRINNTLEDLGKRKLSKSSSRERLFKKVVNIKPLQLNKIDADISLNQKL